MLQRHTARSRQIDFSWNDLFDLLNGVAKLSLQTNDFEQWLLGFMKQVCEFNDWKIGHAWGPCPENPLELQSLHIWHVQPGVNADAFREKTKTLRFDTGVGLPGRVHQQKKLDWIPDVNLDDNYPRKPFANEAGFKGGYGCPVIVDGEVAAVIEFYDSRPAEPSSELIRTLEYLGSQVAPVLERSERARQRVEMALELETKVARTVDDISRAAREMKEAAQTTSTLANQAQLQSRSSAESSTVSSNQIKLVANAISGLMGSIRAIETELEGTRATVANASNRILAANSTFESLKEGAQEIEDVISLINKIADKTKLLSLNATIEASRAGELGAGFAVVASEVKELAAQTELSTNHIAQRVQDIQSHTTEAIGEFKAISETITRIGELTGTISASMDEQQQAGQVIAENSNTAEGQSINASQSVQEVAGQLSTIETSSRTVFETAAEFVERTQDLQVEVSNFVEAIRKS